MKAIITKIQEGKVFAKSVNPFGKRYAMNNGNSDEFDPSQNTKWQQAESERLELEVNPNCFNSVFDSIAYEKLHHTTIKVLDSIQVTREGNFFKII